ncbi:Rieske (2Fe-2S) protein [Maribellus sp. CM-23]|uniref:QcrA and Rieske domain-containing protein n=1 Tax=Maribellus sp. CM-23 TaxID=2781026 RepID=UPI001F230B4E|nr:Rieske (2Fe-2S) protein [Maribellus sp. CM-23]MCE4564915.1 Rieske (2Fe-2S) protein [Maribellus sp. CM-23]
MERKDFLKNFAVGGSILLTSPMLFNACSKDEDLGNPNDPGGSSNTLDLTAAAYSALNTVGGYAYKGNIMVFRTGENSYLALSKICTHQGCSVTYSHADGNVPCPCHGSKYTTAGVVINGPATANLKKYSVTKSGNILTIS